MGSNTDPADDSRSASAERRDPKTAPPPLPAWLDTLFETSPLAMAVCSMFDNRYVRANQAMADLCGHSVETILSSDPFSMGMRFTHPEDVVAEQKLFGELATGARRFYRIEKRFMRPDGSFRWGDMTFAGVFDPPSDPAAAVGSLRYVVIQTLDITERKALEHTLGLREEELRHAQRIDGIGRLAAGIAHDFNNLLTVIIGHGEVLERLLRERADATPVSGVRDSLLAIHSACERAASLTTQLLAHGRRGPVTPRTLELSSTVAALQQLLGRTLGSSVEIDQQLSATGSVFVDEGHVHQVVLNLVLNARDALPEGGRIGLATRDVLVGEGERRAELPPTGEWVSLSVSDTGHGMSAEVQARMFEPFFTTRGDRPGTRGTGLGLATVQRIVADAGGQIRVDTAPGRGTMVTIFLPRVASEPKSTKPPRPSSRPTPVPNSVRILVVEDEPPVRTLIGTLLMGAQYWVMVARDGLEALRFIEAEAQPFDLIVADLSMPGLGGLQLAERLRARGALPRILFVSGYSDHAPADLLPYGSLLPKPFTTEQLLDAVARALDDPR